MACSKQPPSSEKLDRDLLMKLVFPTWKKKAKLQIQALELDEEEGEIPGYLVEAVKGKEPSTYLFEMSAEQLIRLDSNRVVLMTSGAPVQPQDAPIALHTASSLLSAFWFKQVDGRWYADGQQLQIDWVGTTGSIAKSKVVKISSHQFALGVESGDCFQGACFTDLMLYELAGDKVKSLLKHSIRIAADTTGARGDCERIFKQPANTVIRYRYAESAQSAFDCTDITSEWGIKANGKKPGDLLLRFSGFTEEQRTIEKIEAESEGVESTTMVDSTLLPIKQQQLFRYREGKYLLASGKNPIPEF
jgi:hypothetical protein